MVLLGNAVQVFALPQPGPPPQFGGALHLGNGLRIGGVLAHGNRARVHSTRLAQRLAEQPLHRCRVPPGREREINGLTMAVDGTVQVGPADFGHYAGLIDPPRAIARAQMRL
jgi:hypothetical protein